MLDHRIFQRLHHRFCETGLFHLTRPQLFFMGNLKTLVALITEATASAHEIPGNFVRVCQSCITTGGHNFKQLL